MVAIHLDFRSLHAQASASVSGDRVFHSLFNFGRAVVHRIPTVSDTFVLSTVLVPVPRTRTVQLNEQVATTSTTWYCTSAIS